MYLKPTSRKCCLNNVRESPVTQISTDWRSRSWESTRGSWNSLGQDHGSLQKGHSLGCEYGRWLNSVSHTFKQAKIWKRMDSLKWKANYRFLRRKTWVLRRMRIKAIGKIQIFYGQKQRTDLIKVASTVSRNKAHLRTANNQMNWSKKAWSEF